MLICRCAWHSRYYGHSLWQNVVSWRGWRIRFTDGICPRCVERFREEYRHAFERRPRPARPVTAA